VNAEKQLSSHEFFFILIKLELCSTVPNIALVNFSRLITRLNRRRNVKTEKTRVNP
jgi:hypothetical protein